jgi:MFS family permease
VGFTSANPNKPTLRPVVLVALVTGICLLGDSALYVLLPSRLEVFAVTPTGVGLILGINRYIRIVSNNWAGWVYGRLGFYGPFIGSVLLSVVTTASYGLFIGFWPLFIAHCLWGVSWSFLRLGGYLVIIESGRGSSVGRLMGILQSISRGGSLIAVIVGGLLADTVGSRQALVIFGLFTLTAVVLVPFSQVSKRLGQRPEDRATVETGKQALPGEKWKIWTLYAEAAVAWFLIPGLVVGTAGYLIRTIAGEGATILGVFIGVGTLTGSLLAIRWMSDLGLGPLFGYLSDTAGRSKVILTSMGVAFVSLALVAYNQSLVVVILTFSAVFLSSTALFVSLNASIGELVAVGRRTAILSWYTTWADIGSGTGPLIGMMLVAKVGFGWAYCSAAALLALAASFYVWVVVWRSAGNGNLTTSD